jgi:hypothetical protein
MNWCCPECFEVNSGAACGDCGKRWHPFLIDYRFRRLPWHWWLWRVAGVCILRPWRRAMRHVVCLDGVRKWAEGLSGKAPAHRPFFQRFMYLIARDRQSHYSCPCCHFEFDCGMAAATEWCEIEWGNRDYDGEYHFGGEQTCPRCGRSWEFTE